MENELDKLLAIRSMMETDGWTIYCQEAQENIDHLNNFGLDLPSWEKVLEARALRGHLYSIVNARQIIDEDIAELQRPADDQ